MFSEHRYVFLKLGPTTGARTHRDVTVVCLCPIRGLSTVAAALVHETLPLVKEKLVSADNMKIV